MVELLFRYGAKLDSRTNFGWQPIHCACDNVGYSTVDRLEVVQWLVKKGARLDALIDYAGDDEKALLYSGYQPIHLLANTRGNLELVKWISKKKHVALDARTARGQQPLHLACRCGDLGLVFWLLPMTGEIRVDPENVHACDDTGRTPLDYALGAEAADNREELQLWLKHVISGQARVKEESARLAKAEALAKSTALALVLEEEEEQAKKQKKRKKKKGKNVEDSCTGVAPEEASAAEQKKVRQQQKEQVNE